MASISVFISRTLTPKSKLWELESKGVTIHAQSLLQIAPIHIQEIPDCDWIFFYSQKGIDHFLKHAEQLNYELSDKQFGCIGKKTALHLQSYHLKADFIGSGTSGTTAEDFANIAKGKTVLFPTATHSIDKVRTKGKSHFIGLRLPVYKNTMIENIQLPNVQIAVLTSPFNARVFFSNYNGKKPYHLIAIGKTTAGEISKWTDMTVHIPEEPSEESIYKCLLEKLEQD